MHSNTYIVSWGLSNPFIEEVTKVDGKDQQDDFLKNFHMMLETLKVPFPSKYDMCTLQYIHK